MKKNYENPELTILEFAADVITSSAETMDFDNEKSLFDWIGSDWIGW